MLVSPKTRTFSQPKKEQQVSVVPGKDGTSSGSSQANNRDAEQQPTMTNTASHFGSGDSQVWSVAGSSNGTNLEQQNNPTNKDFVSRFSGYLRALFYNQDEEKSTNENQTSKSQTQEESALNEDNWTTFCTSAQSSGTHDENIFSVIDFNMCLRVQPGPTMNVTTLDETNKSTFINHNSFLQPTMVFVNFASLPPLVLKSWTHNLAQFPPPDGTVVKNVQISRLLSLKERAASRTSNMGPSSRENPGSKSQDSTNRGSEPSDSAGQGEVF